MKTCYVNIDSRARCQLSTDGCDFRALDPDGYNKLFDHDKCMYYHIGYCMNAIAIQQALETESAYQRKRRTKLFESRKKASDEEIEEKANAPEPYEPDYEAQVEERGGLDMVLYAQKLFTGRG